MILPIAVSLFVLLYSNLTTADYVGTAVNRILLDPASLPVAVDGFQVNDEISYILETTPSDTGSTVGTGAWATAYMPDGVVVVNAELVIPSGGGYINIPAKDVGLMAEDCGARGCDRWTEIAGSLDHAPLGPGQQDTGIFYSIDPRTVQLATALIAEPSGSGDQNIWNQWDYDQVLAFGAKTGALLGNGGQGDTALVSTDSGVTWKGTGSPVAGPETFYTNDYNPDCDGSSTDLYDDAQCVGPWQRIKYDNAKISALAGGVALAPATTAINILVNNAVLTSAGHEFAVDGALPAATNAVRFVHGVRRLGDIEYARVTFKIVDAAAFAQSVFVDQDFCLDGTGSDTDKPGKNPGDTPRGAQDNIFRYYEGNPHSCYNGSSDANFAKLGRFVNGVPSVGANLAPGDIISYELVFTNTSADSLYDITFTDTATLNLDLIAPGDPECAYGSYNSIPIGAIFDEASLPGAADWSAFPLLAAGDSVSVFVCARAAAGLTLGEQVKNTSGATYRLLPLDSPEPELISTTLGTVSSQLAGAIYSDRDSSGTLTAGDLGLGGVKVELWDDSTGTVVGELDAGDTLLREGITASDGTYEFNGFFGNLLVAATDPTGYSSTGDEDNGTDCATGNGCNVIGRIVLANDEKSVNNDFFDFTPSASDLSLVNSVDNPTAVVGSTVTFTVVLTNDGPDAATNISVSDLLPAGFSYTPNSMTGGDSRDETSAPTLVWGINTLANGQSTTLTFQATVNASGNYVNTAEVTGSDQGDSDSSVNNDDGDQSEDDEDSATVSPTAPPPPPPISDLSLVNSVDNPTAVVGSTVTFTVVLTNDGPDTATNISVTDLLPAGFSYTPSSMAGGDSRDETSAPTLVWGINTLANGQSTTLTFQATVNASGNYVNTAEVTGSDQGDSDSSVNNDDGDQSEDDEDSATVSPAAAPPAPPPPPPISDLSLVNSVDNPTAVVGSTVTFTVVLTNDGPDTATNISVTDLLPAGFSYTPSSMAGGDSRDETSAPTLVWGVNTLANGQSTTLTFQATVNASGNYVNTAEVTGSDQGDSDSSVNNDDGDQSEDDEDSATVSPAAAPPAPPPPPPISDLSLVNSVDNPTAVVGSTVTFTVVLTNDGPDTATNISVSDLLPAGFSYTPSSMAGGDSRDETSAPTLVWGINTLANGQSTTLTFQATVNASGNYVNTAEVTGSDQGDSDSSVNNDDGDQSEDDEGSATVSPAAAPPPPVASISITANPVCVNDTPYLDYEITPMGFTPDNLATVEWIGSDNIVVETLTDQPLTGGRLLWPGAAVDADGNPTDWPGWDFVGGEWVAVPTTVRPGATVRISVNPSDSVVVAYPPATPACNTNPPSNSTAADADSPPRSTAQAVPTMPVHLLAFLALGIGYIARQGLRR